MLSPDVTIEDFSAEDWLLLRGLFGGRPASVPGLVLLVRGGQVYKALLGGKRIDPEAVSGHSLQSLVETLPVRWAARLEWGALEAWMERWAERLDPHQTLLGQGLELLQVAQELARDHRIEVYPHHLDRLPIPSERAVNRTLDAVCPVGKTLLFAAFDGGEVASCFAARRGVRGFDRIVGPESLRRDMGLVSRDWTRDYRHLIRATEVSVGALSIGCFSETATWRRLLSGSSPGAWAAAVAARDVVLHPVTPAIAIPLGLDVGRAALATVRGLARRFGVASLRVPWGPWTPALERARALADAELDLERILGFDPIALLREALEQDEDSWRE